MLRPEDEGRLASFLTFASVELLTLSEAVGPNIAQASADAISARLRALAKHINSINTGPELTIQPGLPDANTESPRP